MRLGLRCPEAGGSLLVLFIGDDALRSFARQWGRLSMVVGNDASSWHPHLLSFARSEALLLYSRRKWFQKLCAKKKRAGQTPARCLFLLRQTCCPALRL